MRVPWLRHKCLVFSCRTEGIKWQNRSRKCFNNFITKLDFVSISSVWEQRATDDEYSAATRLTSAISYFAFHRRWHSSKGRNVCNTRAICPFMYVWCIILRRAAFHVGRRADLSLWHSKRLFSLSFVFSYPTATFMGATLMTIFARKTFIISVVTRYSWFGG